MAAMVLACVRSGTSLTAHHGPWIVALGNDTIVAEGPVLDAALESGGALLRRATATEHLLGEAQPAGSAPPSGAAQLADVAAASRVTAAGL
jgi:hypothetical protein